MIFCSLYLVDYSLCVCAFRKLASFVTHITNGTGMRLWTSWCLTWAVLRGSLNFVSNINQNFEDGWLIFDRSARCFPPFFFFFSPPNNDCWKNWINSESSHCKFPASQWERPNFSLWQIGLGRVNIFLKCWFFPTQVTVITLTSWFFFNCCYCYIVNILILFLIFYWLLCLNLCAIQITLYM